MMNYKMVLGAPRNVLQEIHRNLVVLLFNWCLQWVTPTKKTLNFFIDSWIKKGVAEGWLTTEVCPLSKTIFLQNSGQRIQYAQCRDAVVPKYLYLTEMENLYGKPNWVDEYFSSDDCSVPSETCGKGKVSDYRGRT